MKNSHLECEAAVEQLSLYLYSELSFDEEELLEQHLAGCAKCRMSLEQEKALHGMLDGAAVEGTEVHKYDILKHITGVVSAKRAGACFWS
ncbi:MAG: zf-HC2 domain-containing protein [Bryobacteraceae bacterium]|nr:zf-HC2 domain-containing protein [Bryobacteraceae bacterium]